LNDHASSAEQSRAPGPDGVTYAIAPRRRAVPDDQFGGRLRGTYFVDLDVVRIDDLVPLSGNSAFGGTAITVFTGATTVANSVFSNNPDFFSVLPYLGVFVIPPGFGQPSPGTFTATHSTFN
jgi:hypothetical protein